MKLQTLNPPFTAVFEEELAAISEFYGLAFPEIKAAASPVFAWFEKYWEMVFAENSFELITAGNGRDFAEKTAAIATELALSQKTTTLFQNCCQAFPKAIIGIKLCFSAHQQIAPTVYVRTKTDIQKGLNFLAQHLNKAEMDVLQAALSKNQTLYGLGFSEKNGRLYLKTYTIEDVETPENKIVPGFVSHRMHEEKLSKEHKTYLPEVSLYEFEPESEPLQQLRDFLLFQMQYSHAGHIGMLFQNDRLAEYKIYVERVGGIPTDFSAK